MIQLTNIAKSYSTRSLFSNINLTISSGSKMGLVGRNGSGKSTLFKIIKDEVSADEGTVVISKSYRIASVDQHLSFSKSNLVDEVMTVFSEEEQINSYKAEKILFGLGFESEDLGKDPNALSGGQQVRVNLAKALVQEANLLLLDEPTNYLDIVGVKWLASFLKSYPGEVLIITHDRTFMDQVCDEIIGIYRSKLYRSKGNTEKFYSLIKDEEENYEKTRLNQEKKIKEQMEYVDKYRAQARTASQAQSKLKQVQKMAQMEKLEFEQVLNFKFNYAPINAKEVLTAKDISFGYSDELLFQNVNLSLNKNDKVCIIGKNGRGKSTLLNLLSGDLNGSGEIKKHNNVSLGHFKQTNISHLLDNHTIEQEVSLANPDLAKSQVRSICGTMLFSGDDALKKVKVLSGGEKSRVLLGKILAKNTNMIFLDEPSNHLDQESIEALIEELKRYEGSVVVVTHNERILKEVPNKIIFFNDGEVDVLNGNYDYFLEKIGWGDEPSSETAKVQKDQRSKKELKVLRANLIDEKSKHLKPLKKKQSKLEESIIEIESSVEDINAKMIKVSSGEIDGDISMLSIELSKSEKELEVVFEDYEAISLQIEEVEEEYEEKLKCL